MFLAAKIWRRAGRVGVSHSDHYEEKGILQRLMKRLRRIVLAGGSFTPVVGQALT